MWSTRAAMAILLLLAPWATACRSVDRSDQPPFEVRSDVATHPSTRDMLVFSPDGAGPWPVAFAFHGIGGNGVDMAEFGRALAARGHVVFVPTYRSDLSSSEGLADLIRDGECAYRLGRSIAGDYGGDLDQPVTWAGWSLGATLALAGLSEDVTLPTGEALGCFEEVPRPEVIVAISGCHYEFEGRETGFDPSGWGNKDAKVMLLAGDHDSTCQAWQSEEAAQELVSQGWNADLMILDGADHPAPIFHAFVDGGWKVVPDSPAGVRTIELITDAIAGA